MSLAEPQTGPTRIALGGAPPSGVAVRLARDDEHDAAADVLVAAYTHDDDISDDYRRTMRDVGHWAEEHQLWVAVADDGPDRERVVGVVVTPDPGGPPLSPLEHGGELSSRLLATRPDVRGRGVGETLVRHVVALARERGACRVVLNSLPRMTTAHRLYARLGFRRLYERETRVVDTPRGPERLLAFFLDL